MDIKERLIELGCRVEGDFISHSGIPLKVKWDIERLFEYSIWIQTETLHNFIWEVGKLKPKQILGVRGGGFTLSERLRRTLGVSDQLTRTRDYYDIVDYPCILIDDVLTTGASIRGTLGKILFKGVPSHIAVLVNRSNPLVEEIDGIPVISGVFADEVESRDG